MNFQLLRSLYKDHIKSNPNIKNLLLRKGVFPHDFFDSEDKFKLDHLPEKEEFFLICLSHISEEEEPLFSKNTVKILIIFIASQC